jgi:hypothetical protein
MSVETGPVVPAKLSVVMHARGLLEQIQNIFEQEDVALPERQILTVGAPTDVAWDCEQLVVSFDQIYNGLPGQQEQVPSNCSGPRTAVLTAQLVRCVPTGEISRAGMIPPAPAQMTATAEQFMIDAWLLMDGGMTFADSQQFLGGLADVTIAPAQGGFQASVLTIIAGLV